MAKDCKKRHCRTKHGFISFIVDEDETVRYEKRGRKRKRKYMAAMHRNNNTGKYCAFFGYYRKDGTFERLWLKATDQYGFMRVKDELMHRYHNHLEILVGLVRLVAVKKSITKEGGVPGLPDGKGLPVRRWYRIFKVLKKKKGDFDLLIEGTDGRKFRVASECMSRTYPVNWIEEEYLEN